jgi:hypothetical protein
MWGKNTILWNGEGWIESGMEENTQQGPSWLIQFTYNISAAEAERLKLARHISRMRDKKYKLMQIFCEIFLAAATWNNEENLEK